MSARHNQQDRKDRKLRKTKNLHRRVVPLAGGRSAREWFATLLPMMLASRPVLSHGKTKRGYDGMMHEVAPVYGKPTFRNRIEDGKLV